jgi:hypothetical protein
MALPSSGPLSLSQVNTELDLTPKSQINLNSAIVRALFERPSGTISFSNGYGKASAFTATISSNQLNLNLRSWALANGWNGTSAAVITITPNVYIWSNNTSIAGMTIDGSWAGGLELVNNGFIIGMGGTSGEGNNNIPDGSPGGSAISLGLSVSIRNNNYIAGGGGGGGFGGGGAGGGRGYTSGTIAVGGAGGGPGLTGANGTGSGGGGGGRILPGTGGAAVTSSNSGNGRVPGIGGGAGGGGAATAVFIGMCGSVPRFGNTLGGGGGGWGASGGIGRSEAVCGSFGGNSGAGGSANNVGGNASVALVSIATGGAGGRSVQLNGHTVTWLATGTRWGAIS